MKKATAVLAMCIMLCVCLFGFSGCSGLSNVYEYDDFKYVLYREHNNVRIIEFSDAGKEKEAVIVPTEINGYPVLAYGDYPRGLMPPPNRFMISETLKRIYFQDSSVEFDEYCAFLHCKNLGYVVFIGNVSDGEYVGLRQKVGGWNFYDLSCNIYMYNAIYNSYLTQGYNMFNVSPGNVTYYYNYENAPNDGYYWLDDYGYGESIEYPPQSPKREDYVFGGWYKEAECKSSWDFDSDTLPENLPDEDGNMVYRETRLYAKWTKE